MRSLTSYNYRAIFRNAGRRVYWGLDRPRAILFHLLHFPVCAILTLLLFIEEGLHSWLLPKPYRIDDRWWTEDPADIRDKGFKRRGPARPGQAWKPRRS